MAFTYTKGKYLGDPEYHLDRALFFYYNQNPNYPPYKPCSQEKNRYRKIGYYDKCPSYFYRVCDKISGVEHDNDDGMNCVGPGCEHNNNYNYVPKHKTCSCGK